MIPPSAAAARTRRIFVVTPPGLEQVTAAEIAALSLSAEPEAGGLALDGSDRELYTLNLHLRTASRVLVRVAEFRARTFFELERHAARVPWADFLARDRPVRLRVTSRKSRLYHQRAIAERLHAAIGAVEATTADDEEHEGADEQLFVVRFMYDRCVISADSSGPLLHRRGYRQAVARAPLRETLAAALLLASGWRAQAPLLDPFCGSGTIPIEAALIARRIAPGLARAEDRDRPFAFTRWQGFDRASFDALVAEARGQQLPSSPVRIVGSDRDAGAIEAARENATRAGVVADLELQERPLSAAEAVGAGGWLVTNPPYGQRIGETGRLRDLYAALGRVAHRALPGGRVVMLSADPRLEAQVGIRLRELLATRNGGIPVRMVAGEVITPPHPEG